MGSGKSGTTNCIILSPSFGDADGNFDMLNALLSIPNIA